MMIAAALIAAAIIGIGLLAGMLYSAIRGDVDRVVLFGMALLTGISTVLGLLCAIVLTVVFGVKGDSQKAICSIGGFVLGLVLFIGAISMLVVAGLIEGGA